MGISKEAEANKPKRPPNAYFKFRTQKMRQLGDVEGKKEKVAKLWEQIDPKLKSQLESEYKKELQDFPTVFEAWKKKYNVTDKDLKHDKETKQKNKKPTEELTVQPAVKTKGVKEKQVKDQKKGKKNQTPEKERGKSKKDDKKDDKKDKKSAQKKKK